MRYAAIRPIDVSNGEGLGVALFTQGCPIHCKGCFQPETWDFNGGKEFTQETIDTIIGYLKRPGIKRLTILGGEPLIKENLMDIYNLIQAMYMADIKVEKWLYTGYTIQEVFDMWQGEIWAEWLKWILANIDVIVAGPFIEEEKDLGLKWCGSRNQQVIRIEDLLKHPLKYLV